MQASQLLQINPVLPASDMEMTISFWQLMGFEKVYDSTQYGEEPVNYAVMKRDNLCVHLQLFVDLENQFSPQIRFEVRGVEDLFQEYRSNRLLPDNAHLRQTAWGTKEFGLFDPNKVGITFFESTH